MDRDVLVGGRVAMPPLPPFPPPSDATPPDAGMRSDPQAADAPPAAAYPAAVAPTFAPLLTSCAVCGVLHAPRHPLAFHPVCRRCARPGA